MDDTDQWFARSAVISTLVLRTPYLWRFQANASATVRRYDDPFTADKTHYSGQYGLSFKVWKRFSLRVGRGFGNDIAEPLPTNATTSEFVFEH